MSAPNWTPPHWSQPPSQSHEWNLLEIKQGNLLSSISLNELASKRSGCITFGRMDDPSSVDVVTAHESCSRLHARLAFDSSGNLWLRDLKANNGTFVNNVRLPPEACGKLEAAKGTKEDGMRGSRGVVVYPGDVFKFGASTRIYCLEGPEEFDREVKKKLQVMKKSDANKDSNQAEEESHLSECSWGMGPDEDPVQEEQETARIADPNLPSIEDFFSPSSQFTVPSSLQQLHKTYQTKQYKLQAIQLETSRIIQKEDRGAELTDGQTKQVEKNRERIDTLEKDLEDLTVRIEEGIYGVVHGVQINLRKKRKVHSNKDDDVDDFYDKTAQREKKQRTINDEAESEQSLIQKWKTILKSYEKQREVVSMAQHKSIEMQRRISTMNDDDDEAFFLRNDLTIADEDLNKANVVLDDIEKDLTETECLLKVVNPKLVWDRESNWIGTDGDGIREHNAGKHNEISIESNSSAQAEEEVMMPPPPKITPASSHLTISTSLDKAEATVSEAMPPPASIPTAVTCNEMKCHSMPPPPSLTQQDRSKVSTSKRKVGPPRPSTLGTLAALQQAVQAQPNDKSHTYSQHEASNKDTPLATVFDPRKDEWRAPKDQDGSGRTSLHDKFKGRY